MKKYLLLQLFLLVFCNYSIFAQDYSLDCQVIGSSGINTNIDNISFAGTIGEAFIKTYQNTEENIMITQGFHQPECNDAQLVHTKQPLTDTHQLILHGNPVIDILVFETDALPTQFTIDIVNTLGKVLKTKIPFATNALNQLDCTDLASGMYWLKLSANQSSEHLTASFVIAR